MRREDQPSTRGAILFDHVLDGVAIVPGFFKEIRPQVIEIGLSDIKGLPAASSAGEVPAHHPFGARPGRTDWIGERSEEST
jgi:hypothetical protein